MSFHSATVPISAKVMKRIADVERSTRLIAADGRPATGERPSGSTLCETPGDGIAAMSPSRDTAKTPANAMEQLSAEERKGCSITAGKTPAGSMAQLRLFGDLPELICKPRKRVSEMVLLSEEVRRGGISFEMPDF